MHMHTVATIARNAEERKGAPFLPAVRPLPRAFRPCRPPARQSLRHRAAAGVTWSGRSGASTLPAGTPSRLGTRPSTFFCLWLAGTRCGASNERRFATASPPFTHGASPLANQRLRARIPPRYAAIEVAGSPAAPVAVPDFHSLGESPHEEQAHRIAAPASGRRDRRLAHALRRTGAGRGHQGRSDRHRTSSASKAKARCP